MTQVSFIEAVRVRSSYDGRSDPVTWLCGIARHKLADHFRKLHRDEERGRRLAAADDRRDPGDEADAIGDRDAIAGALATLPALQRAVLVFTAMDGLTVRETAALVGRSESATESPFTGRGPRSREATQTRRPAMSDDGLALVLSRLEEQPPVRPAFAEALGERLAEELGFRRPARRSWRARHLRAPWP